MHSTLPLVLLLILSGCAGGEEIVGDDIASPRDECSADCLHFSLTDLHGNAVANAAVTAILPAARKPLPETLQTDDAGNLTLCLEPGTLPAGTLTLTLKANGDDHLFPLDIRPFGYDLGRERQSGAPEIGPPHLSVRPEPLLTPQSWFSYQVTSPNLQGDLLSFSGTDEFVAGPHNPYRAGTARLVDGVVTDISPGPVIPASAWDSVSQHDPYVLRQTGATGEQYVLYYHGRPDVEVDPAIGRASSTDGITWTPDPGNPVFDNADNRGGNHPALILSEEGLVELWYGSIDGLAFALSSDGGASFENYCMNPVLPPQPDGSLKAADVRWNADHYEMTFAVGKDVWKTAWATSYDGTTWIRGDDLLAGGGHGWDSHTTVNMQYIELEGVPGYLFAGIGDDGNGIGFAEITGGM